jgi:hypothetical protein
LFIFNNHIDHNVKQITVLITYYTTCNILEDEYHFFLNCHLNQQPRNLLINTIENKCPSFTNMSPMTICKQWSLVRNLAMVCLFLKFFSVSNTLPKQYHVLFYYTNKV